MPGLQEKKFSSLQQAVLKPLFSITDSSTLNIQECVGLEGFPNNK